jgi:predicted enzyme related to lactoylglutathione lyase
MSAIGIQGVGQIAITARDMGRAVAFYRELLGLPLLCEVPGAAFFDCGGVRVMLALPEGADHDHPASIVYYRVADLEAGHAALRDAGVTVERAPHMIGRMGGREIWMAFFRDSEGNVFALTGESEAGG